MYQPTLEELDLILSIETAFKDVKREDGVTLHEAIAEDDYLSKEEQLEARKLDTETCWQDIPDKDMFETPSIFSFLDVKGFRYYLPAYMRFCINHPGEYEDGMITLHLCPFTSTQGEKPKVTVKEIND